MPKEREWKRLAPWGKTKMKNNRRLALIISLVSVAVAIGLILLGVLLSKKDNCDGETPGDESNGSGLLTRYAWKSCDGDIACTETVSFREDGSFSYSCGCGSPVLDYDLFDSYEYDVENKVITLKGDGTREIKVLYCDETSLFLKLSDGTFKYFINKNAVTVDEIYDFVREYFDNAQLYTVIKEEKDGVLTLLPQHYSTDERERFEGFEYRAPLARDAKAYTLYARIENGEESFEYEEISFEGAFENEDNSYTCAYVDFNEVGEITTVIIYGATEIWGEL